MTTRCSIDSTSAADLHDLVLVGHRQDVGVGAPLGDHGDQAAGQEADADGGHHHGEGRLAEQRAQHGALQRHAEEEHHGEGGDEGGPEGQAQRQRAGEAEEAAHHHQVALGEVDGLGGLVDEDEAEGDQAVDAALRDAAGDELQELQQAPSPPTIVVCQTVPLCKTVFRYCDARRL
jgi:hypothetical protein